MPRVQTISTNFTAGEQSPRVRGRVDLDKYNASAQELHNVVVFKQGGLTIRPPSRFIGAVKDSSQTVRLIPFAFSRTTAYLLEFGHQYLRVWHNDALVESSPGVPFEVATVYGQTELAALDYSQGADTMLIAHPAHQVQALRRYGDANWKISDAPFDPPAVAEVGDRSPAGVAISNTTVGAGRTISSSIAFFIDSDIGREMTWSGGVARITAIGGAAPALSATATVTQEFGTISANGTGGEPYWTLQGSPQSQITPGAKDPVGATTTLVATIPTWRLSNVGGLVDINGGLMRITSIVDSLTANVEILKELTGVTPAPADAWVLKQSVWNEGDGFPAAVTFFQQRTWLANTRRYPQTMWGSRSGLFFDFTPGTDDDHAVYKTVDSDEINPIDYLHSGRTLIAFTLGGEFDIRGGVEKPITPTNCSIFLQTRWGDERTRPEQVGDEVLFIQRGGKTIRAIYALQIDGFSAKDVSVFSEHLVRDSITSMAFEQSPEQVVWCATGAGRIIAMTYNAEQNQVTLCPGDVGGVVEWVTSIPGAGEDATYLLVRRTINGATKRYIERLWWGDWTASERVENAHDCHKVVTGAPATVWAGFGHLEGATVSVLADGVYMGTQVVTGGTVTLPREATTVSVGLSYVARIRQEPPEFGTGSGTSQGQSVSTHKIQVLFNQTIGSTLNGTPLAFRQFDTVELDAPPDPFSGFKDAGDYGWEEGTSPLVLEQTQPYPWTVLAIVRHVTVNPG